MALTLGQAREWLRLDGTDNDEIIVSLLDAVPGYIEAATGIDVETQDGYPICDTIGRMLLTLWYNAEQAEAERLQRTVDGLIKNLAAQVTDRGL